MTAAEAEAAKPAPVEDAAKQTPLEEAEALVEQLSLQDAFKRFQERRKVRFFIQERRTVETSSQMH